MCGCQFSVLSHSLILSKADGTCRSCIMVDILENKEEMTQDNNDMSKVTEELIAEVLVTLYGGTRLLLGSLCVMGKFETL